MKEATLAIFNTSVSSRPLLTFLGLGFCQFGDITSVRRDSSASLYLGTLLDQVGFKGIMKLIARGTVQNCKRHVSAHSQATDDQDLPQY
jgi:hypothetical protein